MTAFRSLARPNLECWISRRRECWQPMVDETQLFRSVTVVDGIRQTERRRREKKESLVRGRQCGAGARQRERPSIIVSHLWAAVPGPPSHSSFPPSAARPQWTGARQLLPRPPGAPLLQEHKGSIQPGDNNTQRLAQKHCSLPPARRLAPFPSPRESHRA